MMDFSIKLEDLLLLQRLISNQQCPIFKYFTAMLLWALRFMFNCLMVSNTIKEEVFKPQATN